MVRVFEGHSELDNKDNIEKLIKIEYYDGRLHEDYIIVFKILAVFFVPLIILGYVHSKELINDKVYFRISILIFVLMFISAIGKIVDMYWRNKMHYDKYDRLYGPQPGAGNILAQNLKAFNTNTNKKMGTSMKGTGAGDTVGTTGSGTTGSGTTGSGTTGSGTTGGVTPS